MFNNITIIDLTNNVAGPFCTQMFAYFNAEVIKVEKKSRGDDSRYFAPIIDGESINFRVHNRGKKSVELDLKSDADRKVLRELLKKADVFIESYRPGVVEKLGFGYEQVKEINPNIIMCSVSAFGQTGEYSQLPGYDIIAQAMSGMMSLTGYADGMPMKTGPSIADYMGGVNAFGAISVAFYKKQCTGQGDYIDISLVDCLIAANDYYESAYIEGYNAMRSGNHHALIAPYGVFQGPNGSVVIGAVNDNLWYKLTNIVNDKRLDDAEKFGRLELRIDNLEIIVEAIEGWLRTFSDIKIPIDILRVGGIPCAPVLNCSDIHCDEHFKNRGIASKIETEDLSIKEIPARGMHLKFKNVIGKMGIAPKLGEHTAEIIKQLDLKD